MQRKAPWLFLLDIESAVERILGYTAGGEAEFKSSELLQDAVLRQLMVVGEAVQHLPKDLLEHEQVVPWERVVGMRNRLVHGYFEINVELVWITVERDLPELQTAVRRLLKIEKPDDQE